VKRIRLALPSPYVGLRPFTEKDALLFFGRDAHVRDLLAKLERQQRFVAVLGASGTGKSSLVLAGLIPALRRGALHLPTAVADGGEGVLRWNVCVFRPSDAPLARLAHELTDDPRWVDQSERASAESELAALLGASPLALADLWRRKALQFAGEALLLVVDQFEELFRYRQRNPDEAERFVKLLLRSATEEVPIHVVMTMRSDFLGHAVAFHGLAEAINSGLYLTPRLGVEQLRSVVVSPLALVGGTIDPVLANRLVNTLGGEDELPMLEHALLRMWNRARDLGRSTITDEDFIVTCSPREAKASPSLAFGIDRHADEIFATLTSIQHVVARQLFVALVDRREGRTVRRPQMLQELRALVGKDAEEALTTVIEAYRAPGVGFLRPAYEHGALADGDLVDISHESLIRGWMRLQGWLLIEDRLVAELREFQQRAERQAEGGGWLDEPDCQRAQQWRAQVSEQGDAHLWAQRYAPVGGYKLVDDYVRASIDNALKTKAQAEALRRETEDARVRTAEAEAQLQRASAERATAEKAQAEAERAAAARELEQTQQLALVQSERAKEQARARQRERRFSVVAGMVLTMLVLSLTLAWWHSRKQTDRAEQAAEEAAQARNAESLARDRAQEQAALAEDRLNRMRRIIEQIPDVRLREQLMLENIPGTTRALTSTQQQQLEAKANAARGAAAAAAPREDAPEGLKLWRNGSVLRVRLMGAADDQRALVERAMQSWAAHANLRFVLVTEGPAEIRVAFRPDEGAWSYVGTDALGVAQDRPTMNLGWSDEKTALQHFGYVLGLIAENNNPTANLPWDRDAVYKELTSAPNFWDRRTVDGVLQKAKVKDYRPFDAQSVMMKDFPARYFTDGVARPGGTTLSPSDKALAARLYPAS
jgi:hypothetical protein